MKSSTRLIVIVIPLITVAVIAVFVLKPGNSSEKPGPTGPPWFEDATRDLKLDFVHDAGPVNAWFMPQSMGSGVALLDYDQDGRLDLYLIQGAGPDSSSINRLYHQKKDGTFEDVSQGSNVNIASWGTGVAVGDVNNDGWPDLLLTQYGGIRLFLNEKGTGRFRDVTEESGLSTLHWGTSAAFLDYDRDGWLDLVVVNYVALDPSRICQNAKDKRDFCGPSTFPGTVDLLYHNQGGSSVRFEDVTKKAGLTKSAPGLGVLCADFTGDGWIDIFVANDGIANHLWVNQKNGTFRDEALARGVAYNGTGQPEADMGVTIGDVDGDGLFDLFSTHLSTETHTLWRQIERGSFQDATAPLGLGVLEARSTGFGDALGDFDRDGDLDLAYVSGLVYRGKSKNKEKLGEFWSEYTDRNRLFANDGTGKMTDVSMNNPAFCGEDLVGRGLACGDIDNDGDLDLVVSYTASEARIYRNIAPGRGSWLMIRAIDPALKRDAYGAEIIVEAGKRRWTGWINPGYSYQSSNDPRAHFGLGEVTKIDRIRVSWPDGKSEVFLGGEPNRLLTLKKGSGEKP